MPRLVFLVICFSRFRGYFSPWSGITAQGLIAERFGGPRSAIFQTRVAHDRRVMLSLSVQRPNRRPRIL